MMTNHCFFFSIFLVPSARDEQRGQEAVDKLSKEGCFPKFHQLDIISLESIQKFKKFLEEQYGGLDILINNAGIAYKVSLELYLFYLCEITCNSCHLMTLSH